MILVDTSIWIDHFHRPDVQLSALLSGARVLIHPFVLGEIALGSIRRSEILVQELQELPRARMATADEALAFIADHQLRGSGVAYVDAHLLASVRLTPGTLLWTRDRSLKRVAGRMGIEFNRD